MELREQGERNAECITSECNVTYKGSDVGGNIRNDLVNNQLVYLEQYVWRN
jgi:hypothetical protein